MSDVQSTQSQSSGGSAVVAHQQEDPLARLHKMSTTAGLGTTEYVAINPVSVTAIFAGFASGLALLDPILLAIPVLAIVLSIVALHQIKKSGGTQAGRGLAWGGLLLALLFAGLVGGRAGLVALHNRSDVNAIAQFVSDFDADLKAGKFDDAYQNRTTDNFRSHVTREQFANTWKMITGNKVYGKFTRVSSNNRLEFVPNPSGDRAAFGMIVAEFQTANGDNSDRLETRYVKDATGQWRIDEMPTIFSTQPPAPPSGSSSSSSQRK